MDFYDKLGVVKYINAHDTYTVYGGSRMAQNTLQAMCEAAASFVDFEAFQRAVGDRIAALTHNEGAFVTNGSAGAVQLAAAVCMCKDDPYLYMKLPDTQDVCDHFIVMRSQHNAYDKAIEGAGGKPVFIGDADETLPFELEGELKKGAAAVFYFPSILYSRGSMQLEDVIAMAHRYNVPVVVDAAAQLPPKSNLWHYTRLGADMVIFSGGKTLCGPQDSGLMLGTREWMDRCHRFGAPAHGICRASKTSREAVAGLLTALENFLALDEEAEYARLLRMDEAMGAALSATGRCSVRIVHQGPVGQTYPRLFIDLADGLRADDIVARMRNEAIYIGHGGEHTIYISPLNLTAQEAETVAAVLTRIIQEA